MFGRKKKTTVQSYAPTNKVGATASRPAPTNKQGVIKYIDESGIIEPEKNKLIGIYTRPHVITQFENTSQREVIFEFLKNDIEKSKEYSQYESAITPTSTSTSTSNGVRAGLEAGEIGFKTGAGIASVFSFFPTTRSKMNTVATKRKIYYTKSGRMYVKRKSKKTGKMYKQYV